MNEFVHVGGGSELFSETYTILSSFDFKSLEYSTIIATTLTSFKNIDSSDLITANYLLGQPGEKRICKHVCYARVNVLGRSSVSWPQRNRSQALS